MRELGQIGLGTEIANKHHLMTITTLNFHLEAEVHNLSGDCTNIRERLHHVKVCMVRRTQGQESYNASNTLEAERMLPPRTLQSPRDCGILGLTA